mmetsp:Transcript_5978/g.13608  ORF Transcript_5978/g.13608 Transcript_5978/m.13608 type:complete len:222 (+) Transcript_5978:988-1653(+)
MFSSTASRPASALLARLALDARDADVATDVPETSERTDWAVPGLVSPLALAPRDFAAAMMASASSRFHSSANAFFQSSSSGRDKTSAPAFWSVPRLLILSLTAASALRTSQSLMYLLKSSPEAKLIRSSTSSSSFLSSCCSVMAQAGFSFRFPLLLFDRSLFCGVAALESRSARTPSALSRWCCSRAACVRTPPSSALACRIESRNFAEYSLNLRFFSSAR